MAYSEEMCEEIPFFACVRYVVRSNVAITHPKQLHNWDWKKENMKWKQIEIRGSKNGK